MVKQKMLVKSKRDMRHKAIISYQTLVIMVGYQKVAWEKHWVAIFDKQDQTEDQRSPHFSPLPDSDFTVTIHLLRKMTGLLRVAYFNVKRKTRHHQLTSLSSVADPPLAFWLGNRVKFYYVMSFSCSSSIPSGADSSGLKDWGEFHRDLAIILTNRRCWSIGQDWRLHIVLVDLSSPERRLLPKWARVCRVIQDAGGILVDASEGTVGWVLERRSLWCLRCHLHAQPGREVRLLALHVDELGLGLGKLGLELAHLLLEVAYRPCTAIDGVPDPCASLIHHACHRIGPLRFWEILQIWHLVHLGIQLEVKTYISYRFLSHHTRRLKKKSWIFLTQTQTGQGLQSRAFLNHHCSAIIISEGAFPPRNTVKASLVIVDDPALAIFFSMLIPYCMTCREADWAYSE